MATSQTISTADTCSNNELVKVENHKNEVRFTFSQIHQYLPYTTYPQLYRLIQRRRLQLAIVHSPEEEIKLEYVSVQVCNIYVNLSCKLLEYRFMVCFSSAYRSSLITMIVVCLPLLMQWQYAMVNQVERQ